MKSKKILFSFSTLAIIGAAAMSCGSRVDHGINYDLAVYAADLNHNGVIDDDEKNLKWQDSYDVLMDQSNSMASLNTIADKLKIAKDEAKRCSLARYEVLHQAEELVMATSAIVPIYNYADPYLLKDRIDGLYCTELGYKFFDRLVDSTNPNLTEFSVSVGTRAESYDPGINSDASTANILVQVLTGAKRWVPDPSTKIETEADGRKIYKAKLSDGICSVNKKLVTSKPELVEAHPEQYVNFNDLSDLNGEDPANYEMTARYYFTIKPGSVWNDGEAIKSEDFVYAWARASSAVFNSTALGIWKSLFDSIRGFDAWNAIGQQDSLDTSSWSDSAKKAWGKLTEVQQKEYIYAYNQSYNKSNRGGMAGVMETNDSEFQVQLINDSEYFEELLAFPAFMPVDKSTIFKGEKDSKGNYIETNKWALNVGGNFKTNGHFQFNDKPLPTQEAQTVHLVKADNISPCIDDQDAKVSKLNFKLIDDDTNMYEQYTQNQLVMIDAIASGILDKVKATSQWHLAPQIGLFYYIFNVNDNAFDMKSGLSERTREKFRRIMSLLMNRFDICENLAKTGVTGANGLVSKGITEKCYPVWNASKEDPITGKTTGAYEARRDSDNNVVSIEWHERNNRQVNHFKDEWIGATMANRDQKNAKFDYQGYLPTTTSKGSEAKTMEIAMKEAYKLAKELKSECGLRLTADSTEYDFAFENFPQIAISTNSGTSLESLAERIQAYYSLFNIKVTIETQEWQAFSATRRSGDYAFARHGWVADYNDPRTYLDLCKSTDGNNDTQLGKEGSSVHRSR